MNRKLLLAFSGGLDTTYCAKYLAAEGYDVETITVNTGGFDAKEMAEIEQHALALGVKRHHRVDATKDFYENCVRYLIAGNVLRNNAYPLSVSAERVFQAREVARLGKEIGATYLAHGCTGAGNDQVRFDMVFATLYPEATIISPIRDFRLSREASIKYLQEQGVNKNFNKSIYSINKGLWGTSIGGKETLTSEGFLPDDAFTHPISAKGSEQLSLQFEEGQPVGIDGKKFGSPIEVILELEKRAQPYGVGRDIHTGDTVIGLKGRVGFEAPAPLMIIKAHEVLEKHVLTKSQMATKLPLAQTYGTMVHEGFFLDPVLRDIEAFLRSTQTNVTGEVYIKLSPRQFQVLGISSPHDLMRREFGVYGEMNDMWNGEEAKAYAKILANPLKIYFRVNQD